MTKLEALKILHTFQRRMLCINQVLEIHELENPTDMVSPEVATLITGFDSATDGVAARIQRLLDRPTVSMNAEDKAAFQAEIDKLNLMGQDPANPLPPAVVA